MRAVRRHHLERIKRRMTRIVRSWGRFGFQGRSELDRYRAGRMASTHGTHQCVMCRFDKLYPKPRNHRVEE